MSRTLTMSEILGMTENERKGLLKQLIEKNHELEMHRSELLRNK